MFTLYVLIRKVLTLYVLISGHSVCAYKIVLSDYVLIRVCVRCTLSMCLLATVHTQYVLI